MSRFLEPVDSQRPVVNAADFSELSEAEKPHFYKYTQYGEMVDRRELDDVLFHETGHKRRSDMKCDPPKISAALI